MKNVSWYGLAWWLLAIFCLVVKDQNMFLFTLGASVFTQGVHEIRHAIEKGREIR